MHYIIGVFSAIGIRGFIYSICNLDMNICTSTTLALKKVLSRPIFTIKQSDSTPVHWFCEKEIHCCIVIFDGYSGASTQDMTHRQWAKGKRGSTVSFILEMCLTITKENFLIDPLNKQQFLSKDSRQLDVKFFMLHQVLTSWLSKKQLNQLILKIQY